MLNFQPTIVHDETLIELPRPILTCRIHDSWDFLKMKVPLREGDQVAGTSREGVEIMIEGQFGSHLGELKLTEEAMLEAMRTLRSALNVSDENGFILSLFQNESETAFHYFQQCTAVRLDLDLSRKQLYSYSLAIHAADPVLHEGLLP